MSLTRPRIFSARKSAASWVACSSPPTSLKLAMMNANPGSAYFCYELVIRRYSGTKYAQEAKARKDELETQLAKERRTPVA